MVLKPFARFAAMSIATTLLVGSVAAPLAMLSACMSRRARDYVPLLLALAPLPALAVALLVPRGTTFVLREPPLTFALDVPGAMLLGISALLWIAAGAYASGQLRADPNAGRFAEWWLLTLAGNIGVFIAADLVSFYLSYSVVSLAAWGLIVHDGGLASRRAGIIYLELAVLGEAFLLMAFVFLAAAVPDGGFLIHDAVAALPTSPWRGAALVLLILGFGLKIGLVPGHVWMPLTYTAAPIPAAAVLSGAGVKAGVIGFIRFLPLAAAMPAWGESVAAIGLLSAVCGVVVGITQKNPKTVLAYSSISQMGLLAAALGMGLAAGDNRAALGASFSAAHHVLVKGGLFLAIGLAAVAGARLWLVLIPAVVLALSLGGLPFTGGMLAKLAVKTQLGDGLIGALATISAAGSTLLMLHFLRCLTRTTPGRSKVTQPAGNAGPWLVVPWLVVAVAALAIPWALFPDAGSGSSSQALAPEAVWAALWPVLIGAVLAFGLSFWDDRLPRVPAGDIVVLGETAARATFTCCAEAIVRADRYLREWSVASAALLILVIILGTVMLARG